MATATATQDEKAAAMKRLRPDLPSGAVLYALDRGRYGQSFNRAWDFYAIERGPDGQTLQDDLARVTWSVAAITGATYDQKREALKTCDLESILADLSRELHGSKDALKIRKI